MIPIYLWPVLLISNPNMISTSLLHCIHSYIDCLSIPHHLEGANFNTKSKADNRCDSVTFVSNYVRKCARLGKTLYIGRSLLSNPTCCTDIVIFAHFLIDTLCIWFCQFFNALPESNVYELTLLQLIFPSNVVFI